MTVNPLALALTVLAAIGIAFTLAKILDDWRNVQAIRQAISLELAVRGEGRHWIALASLVSSAGQLLVWFGFLAIGWMVLSLPGQAPADRAPTNQRILWVLLYMAVTLGAIQVWQLVVRAYIGTPRVLGLMVSGPHARHQSLGGLVQAADETLAAAQETVTAAKEAVDTIQEEHDRQHNGGR